MGGSTPVLTPGGSGSLFSPAQQRPGAVRTATAGSVGKAGAGSQAYAGAGTPGKAAAAAGAPGVPGPAKEDPNDFSDALLSAGVDLREEEQLLSSSIPGRPGALPALPATTAGLSMTGLGAGISLPAQIIEARRSPFLDIRVLREVVAGVCAENEITPSNAVTSASNVAGEAPDVLLLISLACQEWMSNILTSTAMASRFRRYSAQIPGASGSSRKNASDVAKALRQIAVKDKEREERHMIEVAKLQLRHAESRPGSSGPGEGGVSEEVMHRATNATAALMMSGGRKTKYSWMTSGPSGGASPQTGSPAAAAQSQMNSPGFGKKEGVRLREAREEPGIVLRDLLTVLDRERRGAERTLTKGWARLKD
ncbi:transcription initiation factor TFIID component TAF4 family-domain-containing protein [Dipodascopsis tothii]|uniref:transcription initiation factor TFIID component TAF4 family-domain-containing protein n=1 Tax=Dipodascopsis tothii TaxID=44089 RepID=UPI0034CFB896